MHGHGAGMKWLPEIAESMFNYVSSEIESGSLVKDATQKWLDNVFRGNGLSANSVHTKFSTMRTYMWTYCTHLNLPTKHEPNSPIFFFEFHVGYFSTLDMKQCVRMCFVVAIVPLPSPAAGPKLRS